MKTTTHNSEKCRTTGLRRLLLICGGVYLCWWFVVEALLPSSFNPLSTRIAVVSLYFGVFFFSYFVKSPETFLRVGFHLGACVTTFHYFFLFYRNGSDINWLVGAYISVIALSSCLESAVAAFYYGLYVLALSVGISFLIPELLSTVFLWGMVTILAFSYFSLRARLKLVSRVREQAERLQNLFDGVFEGIVVSHEGIISDANESFLRMFGFEKSEVVGKHVTDFVNEESKQIVSSHVDEQSEVSYEAMGQRRDGSVFPIEVLGKQEVLEDKSIRITALRDLTDSKKSERNRILLEASREALKIRDDFIAIASHELKTPLTTIKIQTQMGKRRTDKRETIPFLPDEIRSFFDLVDVQTERLAHLVEDMLYSSRFTLGGLALQKVRVNLSDIVREAIAGYEEEFRQTGSEISFKNDTDLFLELDPSKMKQVVAKLLSNVIKYGKGNPVLVSLSTEATKAVLTVEDHGIGIAEVDQKRIFERFERAISARNISGMGLGLFICKQIVEAHQGEIEVQSELNSGTSFTVRLPLTAK